MQNKAYHRTFHFPSMQHCWKVKRNLPPRKSITDLDEFCQVDENCLIPDSQPGEDKFAICASKCTCPIGMTPSPNKKRCLEFRKLGHRCENDFQCQLYTDNSVCRETCTCEAGFVRSSDLQTCLRGE